MFNWGGGGSTKSLYRNLCRCLCHSEDLYMCASVSVLLEAVGDSCIQAMQI